MAHARSAGGGTDPNHGQLISGSKLTTFNTTTTTGVSERRSCAWDSYCAVQCSHKWGSVRLRTNCGDEDAGLERIRLSYRIEGSPGRWC